MEIARDSRHIDTDVPSNVYELCLRKLSEISKIPKTDLIRGMYASQDAVEMQGVVVERGQQVPFQSIGGFREDAIHETTQFVKQVLITAASNTMCLSDSDTPKCLLILGEFTVLEHILAQLYVAGMERVVVLISYFGCEIMDTIKASYLYSKMQIEFINLGEDTSYGHARALLSARGAFSTPFLIHTADHIFDNHLISRLASFKLDDAVACVLVDSSEDKRRRMPPTAGKIQFAEKNCVARFSRDIDPFDAIDAGLFLVTHQIFAALELLAYEKPKFSLAEALDVLRPNFGLKYLDAAGDIWLSVETKEQVNDIAIEDTISLLSPWPVLVAKDTTVEEGCRKYPNSGKSVMLAVSAADDDSSLRVADSKDSSAVFDGFVMGVNQLLEVKTSAEQSTEVTPLLKLSLSPRIGSSGSRMVRKKSSFLETADESFVLSVPFPMDLNESSASIPDHSEVASPERPAYLIELNRAADILSEPQQYILAVPGEEITSKRPNILRQLSNLPTDVKNVAVEAIELQNGQLEVQVLIKRQVPIVGYILLSLALLAISSLGVAFNIQVGVNPFLKLFWRSSASLLILVPLSIFSVIENGFPELTTRLLILLLIGSISHALFLMTFLWALNHTSITHAYIFNNCHSLLIVCGRMLSGKKISHYEGIGTGLGMFGGAMTTIDRTSPQHATNVVYASPIGDFVAFIGAIGGVFYLITAKEMRTLVQVPVMITAIFMITACLHFPLFSLLEIPYELSRHPEFGLFGWAATPHTFTIELYIVLVCTLLGTLGYISVLKYFDPIVVSIVMLTEPVIACILGIILHVEAIPGLYTIAGNFLIVYGTYLVVKSNNTRTEIINATNAMSTSRQRLEFPQVSSPKAL